MQQLQTLGGIREDLINALGPIVGKTKVANAYDSAMAKIRSEAKTGAKQAIPDIRAQVHEEAAKTIKPYVIAALVLGVVGVGTAIGAVVYVRRRR